MDALILFVLLTSSPAVLANAETEAAQKVAEALIIELKIDEYFRNFLKENFSETTLNILGNVGVVIKTIQDQKITYTWEF